MKRKIVWLGVSWLIVTALVLASCGPTVPGGEQEEEEEGEEEEEEVPALTTLSIGETYQTPEIRVIVSEVIVTDSYEYYDEASGSTLSKEASPGISFLIITAEVENVGSKSRKEEGWDRFSVSDSKGNTYYRATYFGKDRLTSPGHDMAPGVKIGGKVLFNIQEGASGLKITYTPQLPPRNLAEWVTK